MFTPERMNEVNLFIYEDAIQPVVLALAHLGTLQIEDDTSQDAVRQSRWALSASAFAAQERRIRDLLDTLEAPLPAPKPPDDIDLERDAQNLDPLLNEAGAAIDTWRQQRADALQRSEELRFLSEQMRLLAPLDLPVERMTALSRLYLLVGTIPAAALDRIQTALFRIPFVIIPSYTHAGRTLIFAGTTREYAPILERALRSIFFQPISVPADMSGLPVDALATITQRYAAVQQVLVDLQDARRRLLKQWGERLATAWNRVCACRALAETLQRLPLHGQVYLLSGWVPARRLQETIETVQRVAHTRAIIEVLEPESFRPRVPTQLRNPRVLQGFEALVTNFGVPSYDELDPTLPTALSFLCMYGIMFGDVGHGLLLALAGFVLMMQKGGLARFGPVLGLAGLSAAGFGLSYGTIFGMPLLPALWLRPAEHILDILTATLAAGVVLINIGFGLYLYTNWRNRNWPELLLEHNGVAGLLLYWICLGGGIGVWQGMLAPGVWALLLLIAAGILFLREPLQRWMAERRFRPHQGWGEYAVLGFFEVFEAIISFAGNSLSFVRLGAFAVAHEALSRVVLLIAEMSGGMGWLALLIGTIVVVAFEGLIVGIQTLRLEYYEFFGRFFRGEGRPFKPLHLAQGRQP